MTKKRQINSNRGRGHACAVQKKKKNTTKYIMKIKQNRYRYILARNKEK